MEKNSNLAKKVIGGTIAAALSLAVALPIFAQTNVQELREGLRERAKEIGQDVRTEVREVREESKERVKEIRQNVRTEVKDTRADIKEKREALRLNLTQKKEEAKKRIEAVREEAKKKAEERRAEFKDKVSRLRDERKKQIATRLDERLEHINKKWTDHFNKVLDRLLDVLGKVELRAQKAQTAGKDITAVTIAVQNAKAAVEVARSAVETQAQKNYIVTFESEEKLGEAFRAAKEQLKKDLFGLRDGVMKNTRDAVHNALQALRGVPKVDEEPETESETSETQSSNQ